MLLVCLMVVGPSTTEAWDQVLDELHMFPLFVDGRLPDGSLYTSTLVILPSFTS